MVRWSMLAALAAWHSLAWVTTGALDLHNPIESLTDLPSADSATEVLLKDNEEFDYIVVGAGAAGSAAAARLALAGHRVLLVEAGGEPNLLTKIPGAAMGLLGSDLDWQYKTIPNNISCLSSQGQQCRFSRGKCLGGSTSINYMMYTRGNRQDFNDLNITGWTWADMEPYFLRYEGLQDLNLLPASSIPSHNTNGTMKTEFFTDSGNSWHSRIIQGFEALNFIYNPDVNAESQIGVSQVVGYVYQGERMSTARGYLERKDVKTALKVARNTRCTGIIINSNNEAIGVTVQSGLLLKTTKNLYARKEVILSAGTIGSAQILLLSGIGPADHLKSLGIPVHSDLPVGDNMSDHVLPLILLRVDRGFGLAVPNLFVFGVKGAHAAQWLATRDGPLASNGLTDITAFANTLCYDLETRQLMNNRSECELPTLQVINAYIDRDIVQGEAVKTIVEQVTGLQDNIVDQLSEANVNNAIIVVSPVVLRPYSRGNIRLASINPTVDPAIYPNYLSDERDVEEMLRSITIIEDLVETSVYNKHNASILHLVLEGCPKYEDGREQYWRCYMRHMTYSVFHAVGTASLGAVVDERLRVMGIKRLRVADASVLPQVPRGNTAAACIAIGERVADFVLQDDS